jgi:hypothetical protein
MSEQSTSTPVPAPDAAGAPAPAKASRWEDFIDILYAPSEVFARRANSGFGIPMLVVTLLGTAIFFASFNALQPVFDAEFTRNMAKLQAQNPNMTAEMLAQGRKFGEITIKVMAVIGTPIMIFLVGLTLWICGKLVGAQQTLNAGIMVAAYSFVPRIIQGVVNALQGLLMDPSAMTSRFAISASPARFLDVDTASPALMAFLGRLDVFTIWCTILLGIGLAVTGKIPRSKAMIAAAIVWLLGGLPEILGALRG